MVAPESATLPAPLTAVTAPPAHVVAPEAGAPLTRPAGYVSVNAAPVIAAAFALLSVMVSTEVPAMPIEAGANALAIVGCRRTVSVEEALGAAPALVVVTLPVLFRYAPAVADVTFTVTLHEPFAGTVPPASATLVPLLAAVTTPAPHVVAPPAAAVLTTFAGYVSVNAAPVIAAAFALVSVMVRVELALGATSDGLKALEIAGCRRTFNVDEALAPVPALVVVIGPVELSREPAAADVTLTVTVHEPLAGTVPVASA